MLRDLSGVVLRYPSFVPHFFLYNLFISSKFCCSMWLLISCVLGVWGISKEDAVLWGWGSQKVAILSAIYCLLGVCPIGIVWCSESTGSSAWKELKRQNIAVLVWKIAGKFFTGTEAEDGWLVRRLMPVTDCQIVLVLKRVVYRLLGRVFYR